MNEARYVVPTVYFHRVVDGDPHYTNCPPIVFEAFADLVADRFETLTCSEALRLLCAGSPPSPRALIITFDDGYKDLLEVALPALVSRGLKAVIFPIVDYIGRKSTWSPRLCDEAEHLSAADLRSLTAQGFEIGSHTLSHRHLPALDRATQQHEIRHSKSRLEDLLGAPVTSFSYPYGEFDDDAVAVAAATYEVAFSTNKSSATDWRRGRYALHRFYIERSAPATDLLQRFQNYGAAT